MYIFAPGIIATLLLLAACPSPAADNRLSDDEKAAGWQLLFDGKTTDAWLEVTGLPFPAGSWTVEDGCLKATPNPKGNQDLRSREAYRWFDLQFEWKIAPGGNSGVKYLVQRIDEWTNAAGRQARARGLEYQLADDGNSKEAARDAKRSTASLYSVLAPSSQHQRPAGVFNHSRITVHGDSVEHWLNGAKVLSFRFSAPEIGALLRNHRRGSGEALRESPISLQNHNSETWFRNIKIRRLE